MENTNNNNEVKEVKEPRTRIIEDRLIDENKVIIPNILWDDLSISNDELTIFILLQRNYAIWRGNISMNSIKMLCDYMYIDTNKNKNIVTSIKKIITSLIEKKYILNLYDIHYKEITSEDITDKYYMFYVELEEPPENNFLMLQDIKIDKIFDALKDSNLSKYSLIRYYIACCRVSNNDQNFGFLSQSKLKSLITDSRTIQRYNNILQEKKLIRHCSDYWTPDKHYTTTFIGKWEDSEENFNLQLECEVSQRNLVKTDKTACNAKRKTKQKINDTEKKLTETEKDKEIRELKEKLAMLEKQYEKDKEFIPKVKEEVPPSILESKPKGMFKDGKKTSKGDKEIVPSPKNDENETPQGFGQESDNEDDNWGGEPAPNIDMDIEEELPDVDENKSAREKLTNYIMENLDDNDVELNRLYSENFKHIEFFNLKGKEIAETSIKVREFFKEYATRKSNQNDEELFDLDAIAAGDPVINKKTKERIEKIKWKVNDLGYIESDFGREDLLIYQTYIKGKIEI